MKLCLANATHNFKWVKITPSMFECGWPHLHLSICLLPTVGHDAARWSNQGLIHMLPPTSYYSATRAASVAQSAEYSLGCRATTPQILYNNHFSKLSCIHRSNWNVFIYICVNEMHIALFHTDHAAICHVRVFKNCVYNYKGATIRFPVDGGGAEVFVTGKLFISIELGGALKISHFVTCLYGTVLEINYLFHAESARNYLFQKYSYPPPPWESNGGPLMNSCTCTWFRW